jgi:hypothetical protein
MKNWKNCALIGMMVIIVAGFWFFGCDTEIKCTCPEGTTHEPNEKCCNGTDCKCAIAEPSVRIFPINLFEDNTATIRDERTEAGSKTLEQLGIVEKITNAINAAYSGGSFLDKTYFGDVFNYPGGRVTIFIDNFVDYESYKTVNILNVRFNISYLITVSPDNLKAAFIEAVYVMVDLPGPNAGN